MIEYTYPIKIDFDKNKPGANRIFLSMGQMIESMKHFDEQLMRHIYYQVHMEQYLDRVETGSLISWIKQLLIEEESVAPPPLRQKVVDFVDDSRRAIATVFRQSGNSIGKDEIEHIEKEIQDSVEKNDLKGNSPNIPLNKMQMAKNIEELNSAIGVLDSADSLQISQNDIGINKLRRVNIERIREAYTSRTNISTERYLLTIKKPDLLGQSRWDFKFGSHPLSANIEDNVFLQKIHSGDTPIFSGDSISADVAIITSLDDAGNIMDKEYKIVKVHDFNHMKPQGPDLFGK